MRYSANRRFSAFHQGDALALHIPEIDLRDDKLFFC